MHTCSLYSKIVRILVHIDISPRVDRILALNPMSRVFSRILPGRRRSSWRAVIAFFRALPAAAFKHDLLADHREPSADLFRDRHVVIGLVVKIDDAAALDTPEMMMDIHIRIISLGLPVPLDDTRNADLGEGQKRPVHRVERDVRDLADDSPVDIVRRRVVLGSKLLYAKNFRSSSRMMVR